MAAISTFIIGGIWYSVFEQQWMKENNFSKEYLAQRKLFVVFGLSFLFSLIIAIILALFVGTNGDLHKGALVGLHAGFGLVFFLLQ